MKTNNSGAISRRDFLYLLSIATALIASEKTNLFSKSKNEYLNSQKAKIKFSHFSVEHLKELEEFFMYQKRKKILGKNPVFKGYIKDFEFRVPEKFRDARSVIILAIPQKIAIVKFHIGDKEIPVTIPPGYASFGYKLKDVKEFINEKITGKESRLEYANLPLKLASVHSGLARYGKNNISYIKGLGSYYQLLGFYTDHAFKKENWSRVKPLRLCKGCFICMKACPAKCIDEESFLINIDKCVSLYNEISDPLPEWIDPKIHNSLVGCMKCQYECPENLEHKETELIAELSEAETSFILKGIKDEKFEKRINKKLVRFPAGKDLSYFSRNLKLVLANASSDTNLNSF